MCVICIADKVKPTDDMLRQMYEHNAAGAGIAWREDGLVRWEKGLTLEEVVKYCHDAPLPYVVHFRIPTTGGVRNELCHPFPVEKSVRLDLSGKTKGYVMFHNGHWSDWRKTMMDTVIKCNIKLPTGRWSDSRGMAWTAAHYGISVLDLIDEKAVLFGPADIEIYNPSGWSRSSDVIVSNTLWTTKAWQDTSSGYAGNNGWQGKMCKNNRCTKDKLKGSDYCYEHQPIDAVIVEKSGGASTESPFVGLSPAAAYILACKMHKAGNLSKNKLKKWRKLYQTSAWEVENFRVNVETLPEVVKH